MDEINLYDLIKYFAKKWFVIVALTICGATIGFVYSNYIQIPLYKSDATLLLTRPVNKSVTLDTTMINNYVELFKSRRVVEPVIASQNIDVSYEEIASAIEVTNEKDTEVIKISFSETSASSSKSFLDGVVVSFKDQVAELYDLDNIQVVDKAGSGDKPYNINKLMTYILGSAAGFILSIISLFFIFDYKLNNKNPSNNITLKAEIISKKKAKKNKKARKKRAKKNKKIKAKALRKTLASEKGKRNGKN